MNIAIDVGYGYTKATDGKKNLVFQSAVAPAHELLIENTNLSYLTEIIREEKERYFVGELVIKEGKKENIMTTLSRERYKHITYDVLILTAARLLLDEKEDNKNINLAVGLPIAYYKSQKDELKNKLEQIFISVKVVLDGIKDKVSINQNKHLPISFKKVVVYPQGAGALLTINSLPESGRILVIDVGHKTTDYVTAEINNRKLRPVTSLCGSIEVGVSNLLEMLAQKFLEKTGVNISDITAMDIVKNYGKIYFQGKELSFLKEVELIKENITQTIYDRIHAQLREELNFLRKIYLVGGGVNVLPLKRYFIAAEEVYEPQLANVKGFYAVLQTT